MSRNYKFHNPEGLYFVSFAVVNWVDVFARNEYKEIILETLEYCIKNKGMKIYAWCIMSNHIHFVFSVTEPNKPELVLGDFKRFTIKNLIDVISPNQMESRKNDYDRGIDIFKPKSNTSKFRVQLGKSVPYGVKQS